MIIKLVDIQNFRKLKSCRIEFSKEKTVFVGANNSGKTSAMDALKLFLKEKKGFSIHDITISNWTHINRLCEKWPEKVDTKELSSLSWAKLMPALDVWINVKEEESHHVMHLLPTLDWDIKEPIGVRLVLEPIDIEYFAKCYAESYNNARKTEKTAVSLKVNSSSFNSRPVDIRDFLSASRNLNDYFTIKAYLLDPSKLSQENECTYSPQVLPDDSEPLPSNNPFTGLMLIHKIDADRGLSSSDTKLDGDEESPQYIRSSLSSQLRVYYDKHLNPEKSPDDNDILALAAINNAKCIFDDKLKDGFKVAISELETLGYPGFTDPAITISSKIKPQDTLNHSSAVQYDVVKDNSDVPKLPEIYNGLGYQNLISMVFKLMRFRDEWMKVGKAKNTIDNDEDSYVIPLIHLVLIEEPEAHLHAQVQQVFISKAYDVLRNNEKLKADETYSTQLIVSTHSSDIAHAVEFSELRYFKRIPADDRVIVPTSIVLNLSTVFGEDDDTIRFTKRYLKTMHCDLFFADAVILIEGASERILLPFFIENSFEKLNECYISVLEISGSHAHRLKPLIEYLGIITLIITDLDAAEPDGYHNKARPIRNNNLISGNDTLVKWVPKRSNIDELLDLASDKSKCSESGLIRVTYQMPGNIFDKEFLASTFEDSLVLHNLEIFKHLTGESALMKSIIECVNKETNIDELQKDLFNVLNKHKKRKAELALDLLFKKDIKSLIVPNYIDEGLKWLCAKLKQTECHWLVLQRYFDSTSTGAK